MITHRPLIYGSLCILLFLCAVATAAALHSRATQHTRVHFFDVGQGDAILISEGNNQILIDGGPDGTKLLEHLGRAMPLWDRTIEVVIATHPDRDHIDGLVDVLAHYHVDVMVMTRAQKQNEIFDALLLHLHQKNITVYEALRDYVLRLPSGADFRVVYPERGVPTTPRDVNDVSVAGLFTIGDEQFFLGGDLSSEQEDKLPLNNAITVLKVGHHGSDSSTSDTFVKKIRPRDAIVSAGKNNRYGHPAPEVVLRLTNHGVRIFDTATHGSIVYTCTQHGGGCTIHFE